MNATSISFLCSVQVLADFDPQTVNVTLVDGTLLAPEVPIKPSDSSTEVLCRVLSMIGLPFADEETAAVEWGLFERTLGEDNKVRIVSL